MEHILHTSAKAKVAWSEVCYPKKEGGLGLKDLEVWNISSMLRQVWTLFACALSIWVAWIQAYMLKGRSFWSVSIPQSCSWCWRKVLKLRFIAKNFIKFEVGDGKMIHLWQDYGILLECLMRDLALVLSMMLKVGWILDLILFSVMAHLVLEACSVKGAC